MKVMVNQLGEDEIKDLKDSFMAIDKDNTGLIRFNELTEIMEKKGFKLSREEMLNIFENVSPEKDNGRVSISYTDFLEATLDRRKLFTEQRLWSTFKYFDISNTDEITFEDLLNINKRNGETIDVQELKLMITEADPNNDGNIKFDCFKKLMTKSFSKSN